MAYCYSPNEAARSALLFCRKMQGNHSGARDNLGRGVDIPGMYHAQNPNRDKYFFIVVLFLELIGLFILSKAFSWQGIAVLIVSAAILLDIFLVILSHFIWGARILLLKNQYLLWAIKYTLFSNQTAGTEHPTAPGEMNIIRRQIRLRNFLQNFFKFLLIPLAFLKISAFYSITGGATYFEQNIVQYIFLILIYVPVVIIHWSFTGYYIAYLYYIKIQGGPSRNNAYENRREEIHVNRCINGQPSEFFGPLIPNAIANNNGLVLDKNVIFANDLALCAAILQQAIRFHRADLNPINNPHIPHNIRLQGNGALHFYSINITRDNDVINLRNATAIADGQLVLTYFLIEKQIEQLNIPNLPPIVWMDPVPTNPQHRNTIKDYGFSDCNNFPVSPTIPAP